MHFLRGALNIGVGLSVFGFVLIGEFASAQEVDDANPNQTIRISVSKSDRLASSEVSGSFKHILAPKPGYGVRISSKRLVKTADEKMSAQVQAQRARDISGVPRPGFYPADVDDTGQGPVIVEAVGHPIYVNTTPDAVGYPGALLRDLGRSEMVHIVDEYVGATHDYRYKAGLGGLLSYSVSGALQDADVTTIVHSAAAAFGKTGYKTVYHIFLAPGQDVCSEGTCYSPDNPSNFSFCAYHDSIDFMDIGHVIYTLVPFQAVDGCSEGPSSPNGLVVDSTMSTLSHEFFESITDPDGNAWWNRLSLDLNGDEIADTCVIVNFDPVAKLNGTLYELQAEYSNKYHACSYAP